MPPPSNPRRITPLSLLIDTIDTLADSASALRSRLMRTLVMRTSLMRAAVCALALAAAQAQAGEATTYELDPVHTRVMFAIDHAGFSNAIGTISGSSGRLRFDPDDWRSATLDVTVPVSRLDLGDEKWNRATLARNLLDAEEHPIARFVSTRVEPQGEHEATVYGTLTLRGVGREIALRVKRNALKRHPLPPFRRTVGFSATAQLSRKDFGIDAWPSVIGDAVELRIEAEAVRSRDEGTSEPADAATPVTAPDATDPPATDPDATDPPATDRLEPASSDHLNHHVSEPTP